jgi:DHA1 family bicyclomycin/chloramphenicol resistance-like MFS transporter
VARFLQGFGGAAGVVLSRAVITDSTTGDRTAQLFSLMMAINGIAPVVAPLVGSGLLDAVGWRGILLTVAGLALLMVVGAAVAVPETLPVERRSRGGLRRTVRDVRSALGRPRYVGYTLAFALAFATMFAYISGSPFVLQETLGLPTAGYAAAFGLNAAGLVVASVVSGRLVRRVPARVQFVGGIAALLVFATAFLVVVLAGAPPWPALIVLFLAVSSLGFVLGNGAALATAEVRDMAGTGSALLGALQFGLGAAVSPLVGDSPLTMAVIMVVAASASAAALALTRSRQNLGAVRTMIEQHPRSSRRAQGELAAGPPPP